MRRIAASIIGACLIWAAPVHAQGLYLPGGGAVHTSMGGVSTATPADAIGALYWNPAAMSRLGRSEASIGGAFLFPQIGLTTTRLDGYSARTRSDNGVGVASSVGLVYEPDDGPYTYGLGFMTLGGGSVNYPGDPANPLLSGIGPLGNVQGPIYSNLGFAQMTPTVSARVSDRLVVGVGPTVTIALASFDPAYFASPDTVAGTTFGAFPSATHSRPYWGGGVRAGFVYSLTDTLDVGFGYTSPQWFETWKFYARNEVGAPRTLTLNVSLPAIYSWGVAWRPSDKLLLGVDLRYFDYANSELFGTPLRDGGLGWDSVFAVAAGARYQWSDRLALMAGYVYNDNPLTAIGTLFNVQGPAIMQNTVTVGSTFNVTDALSLSVGYSLGFRNTISGAVREATGAGVQYDVMMQTATFALQVKFGGGCRRQACATDCAAAQVAELPRSTP